MKLKVKCLGNPDWNGEWDQKDVEEEIRDLAGDKAGIDWVDWVLDHLFDSDVENDIVAAMSNSNVRGLTFMSPENGFVEITKRD